MFFYVYGIENKQQADFALSLGVDGLGVRLSYDFPIVKMERCREIFLDVPKNILRVGIFGPEPYYEIEEFATFCDLTGIQFTTPRGSLTRYLYTTFSTEWDNDADFWSVNTEDKHSDEVIQKCIDKHKVVLFSPYCTLDGWKELLCKFKPYGVGVHINDLTEELAQYIRSF